MKYFFLLTLSLSIVICSNSFAQDSIVTSDGQKIRAKVLKINWKDVKYKVYDDPEFSTYTLLEKDIKTIKLENGKKYLFNHNLPRAFIGVNFDVYQPVGSFGKTDFTGKEPGFAIIGLGGNIQAGFYFTKRLGMHLRVGAGGNRLNVKGYEDYYADKSDAFEVLTVNYDSRTNKQNYESWGYQYATLGPMYSFKLAKWLTVDTRLEIGVMNVHKPSVRIYAYDSLGPAQVVPKYSIQAEKANSKTMTAYGGGLTLRISPVRRVGFMLSADYIHTGGTLHFREAIWSPSSLGASSQPEYVNVDRTYNIDQIRLSVGIAYQFKRKNR